MIVEVVRWQIFTDYVGYPNWIAPRYIVSYIDDATDALSVKIRDGSDNVVESPTSGPPIYSGSNGMANQLTPLPFYQRCDGTTLKYIQTINTFPYVALAQSLNDSQCQIAPVCDLAINSFYNYTNTTAPDLANGSLEVFASSSNGVIKYALNDPAFDYASATNTTGEFTGLLPGTYTVYAKDEIGCTDSKDITIEVTTVYGIKFQGEYNTVNGFDTRINILERGYDGELSEVCFSGTPLILDYDDSDKFTEFIASNLTVELLEEVEDQFIEFKANADDRKYRIDYYKFLDGDWVLTWTGYMIPEFGQRPFVRTVNNYVTVKATDQLGQLKLEPFVDASENIYQEPVSQLFLITEILKKTGLELNIRIQDNLFETDMDTDKSPLEQAYLDPRIFYKTDGTPFKCDEALRHIIKVKTGLRLFQSYGLWWLVRSEYNVGSFDYFEYDIDGELQGDDTYTPVKTRVVPSASSGIFWANASQLELFETSYGNFLLTHTLGFDDNLIDEGRFEEEDVIDLSGGNKGFKNWSVNLIQPGVKTGLEFVENGNSKGAFFMDFVSVNSAQADNQLYSIEIPVESNTYGIANLIKFKFQYKGVPYYKLPWILLRWEIRFISNPGGSDVYLYDTGLPTSFTPWLSTPNKNDIYIENYESFHEKSLTTSMPNIYGGTMRISFYMHNHYGRDFANITALKAFDTIDLDIGKRVLAHDGEFTHFYELEHSEDADDSPDLVRPDDWAAAGDIIPNPKVWVSKGKFFAAPATSLVRKFLLDNVQLTYIPYNPLTSANYIPPSTASYDRLVTKFNKMVYEDDFLLGDLPIIENGKNLYRGFLRYEDGTPTSLWYRNGVDESRKLLDIAKTERVEQLKNVQKKIQSDILQINSYYAFVDALSYDSKRYLNGKYTLDDKRNIITTNLIEMTTGAGGEPPVEIGAFSIAYSDAYDN